MSRPARNNADYFPHNANHGKEMFYMVQKYGNDGYAAWFILREELCKVDYHYLDLSSDADLMYITSQCRVDEAKIIEILGDMARFHEINKQLWEEHKVIWCPKLIDGVGLAYKKRNNSCMSLPSLVDLLKSLGTLKPSFKLLQGDGKPGSKEKRTKENIDIPDSDASGDEKKTLSIGEKYNMFIEVFNEVGDRQFRGDDKSRRQFEARLKKYTGNEMRLAVQNLYKDPVHRDKGFKYATPEFITRPEIMERYVTQKQ